MISIIVPIYNAERYLNGCIDSILRSSYRDFELFLINDGSTDNSLRICQDYARADRRIYLIDQKNRGASAARNRGLELCRGDWIVFVDADDMIGPDFLSLVAQKGPETDMILFDHSSVRREFDSAALPAECQRFEETDCLKMVERILVAKQFRSGGNVDFRIACAKAYRRSIIEAYHIRFLPEVFYGEDLLFNLEYQLRMRRCVYIPYTAYFYNLHDESICHRFNMGFFENHRTLLEAIRLRLEWNSVFDRMEKSYYSYVLYLAAFLLVRVIFSPSNERNSQEKSTLCELVRQDETFREAMRYNLACGQYRRRITLFCLDRGWDRLTGLFCRISHVLQRWRKFRRVPGVVLAPKALPSSRTWEEALEQSVSAAVELFTPSREQ